MLETNSSLGIGPADKADSLAEHNFAQANYFQVKHQEDQFQLFDKQNKEFHDFKHSCQSMISNTVVSPSPKLKQKPKRHNNTTENKLDKQDQENVSYKWFPQMSDTFSTWPKLQLNLSGFWDEVDYQIPPPNEIPECPLGSFLLLEHPLGPVACDN